jgi:aerobic carbon-monoxide dehydrogenase large subunit
VIGCDKWGCHGVIPGAPAGRERGIHNPGVSVANRTGIMDSGSPLRGVRNDGAETVVIDSARAEMGEFAIGQGVPRFEDPRLLRGGGCYVDDMVLPGMAFGHVLRSPHAHARKIRVHRHGKAKAAPGVLAVLTGADWIKSGWGDLPVPGGHKRRDGSPNYRPPYPALVKDRVRFVGDYVAFVVAETRHQAADAAELIEVDYEPLPASPTPRRRQAGRAAGLGRLPGQHLLRPPTATRPRPTPPSPAPPHGQAPLRHQPRHRATMEPRGSSATTTRATAATRSTRRLQRAHGYRSELAAASLKVPESRVRVVAGDIGGSFGMKSAVYNEVGLVLLASKLIGRPVKWIGTRSESFLSRRAGARQRHRGRARARQGRQIPRLRVKPRPSPRRLLQPAANAYTGNLGTLAGVYRTPAIHVDVSAVFTNTTGAALSRQRPPGGGLCDRAHGRHRRRRAQIDPAELRRRNYIPPEALPYKTALTFTYDSGEFEKNMDMALALAD